MVSGATSYSDSISLIEEEIFSTVKYSEPSVDFMLLMASGWVSSGIPLRLKSSVSLALFASGMQFELRFSGDDDVVISKTSDLKRSVSSIPEFLTFLSSQFLTSCLLYLPTSFSFIPASTPEYHYKTSEHWTKNDIFIDKFCQKRMECKSLILS